MVSFWTAHDNGLSVCRDDEDRRLTHLTENVGHLFVLSVPTPDHPNPAARRSFREHFAGAIFASIKVKNTVERCLNLFGRKGMRVDLLKVPFDPLELPHARAFVSSEQAAGNFVAHEPNVQCSDEARVSQGSLGYARVQVRGAKGHFAQSAIRWRGENGTVALGRHRNQGSRDGPRWQPPGNCTAISPGGGRPVDATGAWG